MAIRLYSYWRSTAAYRVRIALNLKELPHTIETESLLPGTDEHRQPAYREKNPQMLVPYLEDGDFGIGQSQAILEYLEETWPEKPLLPDSTQRRAEVRSFCNALCCYIHPLNNLRVLLYLGEELGVSDADRDTWYAHWIREGFRAAEQTAVENGGPFVFGEAVTLADCCLVPQLYNAHRFGVDISDFPTLRAIETHCLTLPAFAAAVPEKQPDAPVKS
mgnify:CR=1 FL=1